MVLFLNGRETEWPGAGQPLQGVAVALARPAEEEEALAVLMPQQPALQQEGGSSRFESYRGLDYVSLIVPDMRDVMEEKYRAEVYLAQDRLLVVHKGLPAAECLAEALRQKQDEETSPQRALYMFFNLLTEGDAGRLADMEEEIARLEDSIADKTDEDYNAEISLLRKRLLVLKRHYESLFDLLVDLEENQNGLFNKGQLKFFRILTNRADRLTRSVLNLRDYVTQVREAYQAQIDISQNETMKLFTVITAVFLPLSLIAGWFGMNLMMPEYGNPYAYPLVIGFSILVAVGCLIYFKKRKWF